MRSPDGAQPDLRHTMAGTSSEHAAPKQSPCDPRSEEYCAYPYAFEIFHPQLPVKTW
jgi:hypothetical protein